MADGKIVESNVGVTVADGNAQDLHIIGLDAIAFAVTPSDRDAGLNVRKFDCMASAPAVATILRPVIQTVAVDAGQQVDFVSALPAQISVLLSFDILASLTGDQVVIVFSRRYAVRWTAVHVVPKRGVADSKDTSGHKIKSSEISVDPRDRRRCDVEAVRASAGKRRAGELGQRHDIAILVNVECDRDTAGDWAGWACYGRERVVEAYLTWATVGAGLAVVTDTSCL